MMQTVNTTSVVLVALLAISVPLLSRLVSSPLTILLLSPLLLLLIPLTFFLLTLLFGYVLDIGLPLQTIPSPSAAHPLAFSTPAAWQAVLIRSQWSHKPPQSLPPLYPKSPMISAAINEILILVVRDFVLTWYRDISSSPSFPTAVSATLHSALGRLFHRLSSADPASIIVKRVLPKITTHVEQFRESEIALRGAGLERRLTESEELDVLLASRYASKGGKLHPAINNLSSSYTKQAEENHLKYLLDRILPLILPESEAHSKVLCVILREIAACAILYPLMDMLADPDFLNWTIDQLAGAAIRQRRLISKVRNVLEAQLPNAKSGLKAQRGTGSVAEAITLRTDQRQFDSFLRSIDHMSSLLDARRLKNDIMGEIRRTRALLAAHQKDDWINGARTEDVVAYLDRLYTATRKAEQRINTLGGCDEGKQTMADTILSSRLNLRDILGNPSSLSYFMEFMDRQNRSLLIQFWLTVESFKNPLESIESDDSEDDILNPPSQQSTAKEDITMIHELYFPSTHPHSSLSAISSKYISAIRDFLNETSPTPSMERRARKSVMLAQRQVEQAMEQDFEEFESSELWFRVVEDIGASRAANGDNGKDQIALSASDDSLSTAKSSRVPPLSPPPVHRSDQPSLTFQSAKSILHPRPDHTPPSLGSMLKEPPVQQGIPTTTSSLDVLMSSSDSEADNSRAPLFDYPGDTGKASRESESTIEAIQSALSDIIALDNQQRNKSHFFPSSSTSSLSRVHLGIRRLSNPVDEVAISTEEDENAGDESSDPTQESFHLPGPGDLQLSLEITLLAEKISALQAQDTMLDSLIKKAELTGDVQELRLLEKSKSSFNRELRELTFQKTQFEQQEVVNRLIPDRTRVTILNSVVGEENGKSVVRYLVEVQQLSPDGGIGTGWVVARRYNEFLDMHNKLRDRYTTRLVTALSASFVDLRRAALERYMQNLVMIPAVCESPELRAFLSRNSPFMVSEPKVSVSKSTGAFPGTGLVRHVYHSVAGSIDDMFFGPSMLDVMIQRLTRQAAELAGIKGSSVTDEDAIAQAFRASGKASPDDTLFQFSGDLRPLEGETSSSSFSSPICDLILSVFELNKKNKWLRRQAIIIIMQQVLGSTVERKVRDTVNYLLDEMHIMNSIGMFRDSMWPGGQLRPPSPPRSAEEKAQARYDANRMLSALIPDLAANMIGRSNARRGARRIFAVLQNRRLNQHLAYTILDEVRHFLYGWGQP
ncbi:PhoX domain-containing protein [Russula earlei]|uniref:PhoX domain-containing protein n=1 Tax=Russula earlei TaxID=71964 RepID=A0ACC0UP49_9AGAM|nr:PhoX domain-containing protein [Russula earlei]